MKVLDNNNGIYACEHTTLLSLNSGKIEQIPRKEIDQNIGAVSTNILANLAISEGITFSTIQKSLLNNAFLEQFSGLSEEKRKEAGEKITSVDLLVLQEDKRADLNLVLQYCSNLKIEIQLEESTFDIPAITLYKLDAIQKRLEFDLQNKEASHFTYNWDKKSLALTISPLLEKNNEIFNAFFESIADPNHLTDDFYTDEDIESLSMLYFGADAYEYQYFKSLISQKISLIKINSLELYGEIKSLIAHIERTLILSESELIAMLLKKCIEYDLNSKTDYTNTLVEDLKKFKTLLMANSHSPFLKALTIQKEEPLSFPPFIELLKASNFFSQNEQLSAELHISNLIFTSIEEIQEIDELLPNGIYTGISAKELQSNIDHLPKHGIIQSTGFYPKALSLNLSFLCFLASHRQWSWITDGLPKELLKKTELVQAKLKGSQEPYPQHHGMCNDEELAIEIAKKSSNLFMLHLHNELLNKIDFIAKLLPVVRSRNDHQKVWDSTIDSIGEDIKKNGEFWEQVFNCMDNSWTSTHILMMAKRAARFLDFSPSFQNRLLEKFPNHSYYIRYAFNKSEI